jgi:hypothetical protein
MVMQDLVYVGTTAAVLLVSALKGRGRVGFFNVLRAWVCGHTEIAIQKERARALLSTLDRLPPGGMVADEHTGLLVTLAAVAGRKTAETPESSHRTPEAPKSR